jgi:hypothetical protein
MSVQLSAKDYYDALTGNSVTLNWDVLVSYTAKELNVLLKSQWAATGTSKVIIERPNLRHHYSTHYELVLGPPSLQFNTDHSGSVSLHCTLDGTYRDDEVDGTGKVTKIGTQTSTLKSGVYTLSIDVPIQAVTVDRTKVTEVKAPAFLRKVKPNHVYSIHQEQSSSPVMTRLPRTSYSTSRMLSRLCSRWTRSLEVHHSLKTMILLISVDVMG